MTGYFFIMEDRLAIKEQATIINKCNALKLKQTSNLYLVSSWRVFKRMHIKHKWGSLAKDHGNTHLIKSLKPILDCLQPILLIYKSGRLMWSLVGKTILAKHYTWNIIKLRERSNGITETCQNGHWRIMLEREKDETHIFR